MSNETQTTLTDAEIQTITETVTRAIEPVIESRMAPIQTQMTKLIDTGAEIGNDVVPAWRKQSLKFINALARAANGDQGGSIQLVQELNQMEIDKSDAARNNEAREAMRIISETRLPQHQKNRIMGSVMGMPELDKRTLQTVSGQPGQHLLPKPYFAELLIQLESWGLARRYGRNAQTTNKVLDIKSIATKPTVAWTGENVKIAQSSIVDANTVLTLKSLKALLTWTNEWQEWEVFSAPANFGLLFAEAIAEREDKAFFFGAGGSDTANGGFTGMLFGTNVVHLLPATKITFDTVTEQDLSRAKRSLTSARQSGGMWFMNQSVLGSLERLKDSNGSPIFRQSFMEGAPDRLLGDPVVVTDALPGLGEVTQNDKRFIVYGNPSEQFVGIDGGMKFEVSNSATIIDTSTAENSYSAFQQDGQVLKVVEHFATVAAFPNSFAAIKTPVS